MRQSKTTVSSIKSAFSLQIASKMEGNDGSCWRQQFPMLIFWKSSLQIQMHRCGELNILCIGELMAGKSTFLEAYTGSDPTEEYFKIFLRRENAVGGGCMVYLHEIEERVGVDVYLKGGFDGILFFAKIEDFHNTSKNVLESLALFSQATGSNVYKIPIKIVVISSKNGEEYDDIGYGEKRSFRDEVSSLFSESQIIYVESDHAYEAQLTEFYKELLKDEGKGIKESTYSNWYIKGMSGLISFDQFKLQMVRLYEQMKDTLLVALKLYPRKWRNGLL